MTERLEKWGATRPRLTFEIVTTSWLVTGCLPAGWNECKMCHKVGNDTNNESLRFQSSTFTDKETIMKF